MHVLHTPADERPSVKGRIGTRDDGSIRAQDSAYFVVLVLTVLD